MNTSIEQIVQELYALDPALREHDTDVRALVAELIKARPDVLIDKAFQQELRSTILHTIETKANTKPNVLQQLFKFNFMNYKIISGLAVLVVVVAGGVWLITNSKPGQLTSDQQLFSGEQVIETVDSQAFGGLLAQADHLQPAATGLGSAENEAPVLEEVAGDEVAEIETMLSSRMQAGGGGGFGAADTKMLPYQPVQLVYEYTGEDLDELDDMVTVYKRTTAQVSANQIEQSLQSFEIGNVNIGSFDSTVLQNFSVAEQKDFGHVINVDVLSGQVSIYENWLKWQTPERQCQDQNCYERYRLSMADVPADDAVIATAQQFLQQHDIGTDLFAEPYVQNDWKLYMRTGVGEEYVPDILTVIFPLKINDQVVYDQGGNPTGLGVGVNIRHMKVSNVWNLIMQSFQASEYQGETSADRLVTYAEEGGMNGYYYPYMEPNTVTVTAQLGTPQVSLVQTYQPNSIEPPSDLYVPALLFPVIGTDDTEGILDQSYMRPPKFIVVPLAKEMLVERPQVYPLAEPVMMEIQPVEPPVDEVDTQE